MTSLFKSSKGQVFDYCKKNNADSLEKVIKKKNKNEQQVKELINHQDRHSRTPLIVAVQNQAYEAVEVLLNYGANVEYITYEDGSALHIAAKAEDVKMCTMLLEHGANPFVENAAGWTPLDFIARKKDRKAFKILEGFFHKAVGYGFIDFKVEPKEKNEFKRYLCLLFYRDSYRDLHHPNPSELNTPQLTIFAWDCGDVAQVDKSGAPKTKFGWVRKPAGFIQQKLNSVIVQKEKKGASGRAITYGVSYMVDYAAKKIALTALKGALRVNIVTLVLMFGLEQGLKHAPQINDEQLKLLIDKIPIKAPEEVIVLNEAEVNIEGQHKNSGRNSQKGDFAPETVILVKLHEQHKKLDNLYIDNLDENKSKEVQKSKELQAQLAYELAKGDQDKYIIHMKVPPNDDGFVEGVIAEINKAPPTTFIQDEINAKKHSPYTSVLIPIGNNHALSKKYSSKHEKSNSQHAFSYQQSGQNFGNKLDNKTAMSHKQTGEHGYDPLKLKLKQSQNQQSQKEKQDQNQNTY